MIRANKRGLFPKLVNAYLDRKLRRSFRAVWLRGELPSSDAGLLLYANHTNFWDGFICNALARAGGRDAYCLMEEENLARYRFLSRIGAFSIRRGDARSSVESLRYMKELARRPKSAVFVFPEGEIRPFGAGPLRFERGLEVVARSSGVEAAPVALRYVFFEHEKPDVLVEVGRPEPVAGLERARERLQGLVDGLSRATSPEGFRLLVKGSTGVADAWDRARGLPSSEGRATA